MHVRRCGAQVVVWAPAKLNLFLEVLARRHDGYHEIETLMTAIDLFDTLYFAPDPSGRIKLSAAWIAGQRGRATDMESGVGHEALGDLPDGADNLVVRAVALLRRRAGLGVGAWMSLIKRIPSAAGLGGASSDAAAALVAANLGWKLNWPARKLETLAAELGSDVPFFLRSPAAVCRGRGERIESVAPIGRLHLVVARPPDGLTTSEVFRRCHPADPPQSVELVVEMLQTVGPTALGPAMLNRLETDASELSPSITRLRNEFSRLDLIGHQMSGSGTSYFGLCRHARHARRIAALLQARRVGLVFRAVSAGTGLDRPAIQNMKE